MLLLALVISHVNIGHDKIGYSAVEIYGGVIKCWGQEKLTWGEFLLKILKERKDDDALQVYN